MIKMKMMVTITATEVMTGEDNHKKYGYKDMEDNPILKQ